MYLQRVYSGDTVVSLKAIKMEEVYLYGTARTSQKLWKHCYQYPINWLNMCWECGKPQSFLMQKSWIVGHRLLWNYHLYYEKNILFCSKGKITFCRFQWQWNFRKIRVGVTKPITSDIFLLFSEFSIHSFSLRYWDSYLRVSNQVCCCDTCQIWMWNKRANRTANSEMALTEINKWGLCNAIWHHG